MSLSVYYTPIAKETFVDTYHSIQEKYGVKTADKFKLKAEKVIDLISKNIYYFFGIIVKTQLVK